MTYPGSHEEYSHVCDPFILLHINSSEDDISYHAQAESKANMVASLSEMVRREAQYHKDHRSHKSRCNSVLEPMLALDLLSSRQVRFEITRFVLTTE